MATLEITISLKMNGQEVTSHGFPFIRRKEVDEVQMFDYTKADDSDDTTFTSAPIQQLDEVQVYVAKVDAAAKKRFDNQSDASVNMNAGGMVVLFDVDIDAGSATNVLVNANGVTPQIVGLAGGT